MPNCDIVDCHHHFGIKKTPEGEVELTASDLIYRMDKRGIRISVVKHFVSALHTAEDFINANRYVAAAIEAYPDRLVGTVVVNPLMADLALQEIETYARQGFKGVKLHPMFHGYYDINEGVADDVASLAGDLSLPVFIHSDSSTSICNPYEIVRFAKKFPHTVFVMLHFGLQPDLYKHIPDIVKEVDNVLLDTSETSDTPYEVFVHPVRVLGASRLLLGSDGPGSDVYINLVKLSLAMEEYGLSNQDAVRILSTNAHALLQLPQRSEMQT